MGRGGGFEAGKEVVYSASANDIKLSLSRSFRPLAMYAGDSCERESDSVSLSGFDLLLHSPSFIRLTDLTD